ncbi:hypothetical protein BH09DEP1_BH09DEP1_5250 [soil metagenome]
MQKTTPNPKVAPKGFPLGIPTKRNTPRTYHLFQR